jgi:hypothetical protein
MPKIKVSDRTFELLSAYAEGAGMMMLIAGTDTTVPASLDQVADIVLARELATLLSSPWPEALPSEDDGIPF